MKNYYLAILKNNELDARSEQLCGQKDLFLFKVCSDYEQVLRVANQGLPAHNHHFYGCLPQSFPTANSANWRVEGVYAFKRMRDARRTARFLEKYSLSPRILGWVRPEIRVVHHIRWSGSNVPIIRWNGTKRLRHMPKGTLDTVMSIVTDWSAGDRIAITKIV